MRRSSRAAAALIDLQHQQDLVLLRRRRRRLDKLDVGGDEARIERNRPVALGLQVAGLLVGLGRQGALDPLQPPDRAAVAREAGENRAPGFQLALLLGPIEQAERSRPHRERGGVGACAAVVDHADPIRAVGDFEHPQPLQLRRQRCLADRLPV